MKNQGRVNAVVAMTAALSIFLPGCVKRTLLIESDPSGAQVWINEHPAGTTPVTREFITHGRYKFRLRKSGFRELVAREMVRAPFYQWIPLDFFFELMLPVRLEDRHLFRYALTPEPLKERLQPETPEDLQAFLAELKDPNPSIRRAACVALARRRDLATASELLLASRDPIPAVRMEALAAWRAIRGVESMDRLEEALEADVDAEVRWRAAAELEALGDPRAVPPLIEALKDRDPLVRAGAAEALRGIPDSRALSALIRALKDSDTSVRRSAVEALGRIGDRSAVRPLSRLLFHHDFQTRRRAANSLKQLKDPSAAPALVRTFSDWDPKLRQISTETVIELKDASVVPLLIRYLRAWKPWTREHAAAVLGGLKDPRALEPLMHAFRRETDPAASQAMLAGLKSLGAKVDSTWEETDRFRKKQAEERQKKALGADNL